jgi:Ca2+-binding RTX toxin-like protein
MAVLTPVSTLISVPPSLNDTPGVTMNAGDTLTVARSGVIYNYGTGSSPAILAGGANTITVAGSLIATQWTGIQSLQGGHTITLAATGWIFGKTSGILFNVGGNTINNQGAIGGDQGIFVQGTGSNALTNSGVISGPMQAVALNGAGNTVVNSGSILGSDDNAAAALYIEGGAVTNTGTIQGGTGLYFGDLTPNSLLNSGTVAGIANLGGPPTPGLIGGALRDVITNSGTISSRTSIGVNLRGGDDLYDGRLGRAIGEVHGGDGNDTLLGGSFLDIFRGGSENDTLNGGGGADFLDGGAGNDTYQLGADTSDTIGDASGIDTVTSNVTRSLTWGFIENLILTGAAHIGGAGNNANNSIVGNDGNNDLVGHGGNDVLVGNGGNDQLFGQADKDSLTGGAGNDRFVFHSVEQTAVGLGDVIVDLDDNGDDVMDLTATIPGVFTFIGQQAFTAANQVRYQQAGANVLVEINTTGNATAEGQITLLNTTIGNGAVGQVNAADFLL